jgi:hypothetical protein
MTFVKSIANHVKEANIPLEDLTIIVPSERMRKYIAAALYEEFQRPTLAPEMITIDHWIKRHTPNTIIDKTRALVLLFNIQLKHVKEQVDESFDEFLTWGEILLNDFNEIDRYLLEAKQVFKNLADIKEIENWSFDSETLTEGQKRFMEFWDRLPVYYNELNKTLKDNNQLLPGSAFQEATVNIDRFFTSNPQQRFLFAGFNALSPAETSLIKQLSQMGRADILVDADEYYVNNKQHEAGTFIRKLKEDLGVSNLPVIKNELIAKTINIELIECAQNTGQVKVAASIIQGLTKDEINETLLLLADESLITSLIKNLPANIGKANITLGLPIKNTAIKTWMELLFAIQENKVRFKTNALYYADFQSIWNHPFILALLNEDEKKEAQKVEQEIIKRNKIFVSVKNINVSTHLNDILTLITTDWENDWRATLKLIRSLNQKFYGAFEPIFAFEKAILECFDGSLIDFENILAEGIPDMSLRSFKHLFNQHWSQKSIAYHGNPLDGIQIMGLLETRGLDFKRIICIGMNEGKLPPTNPIQTMIPMDLRRYLGLPTPREKQGLFSHHFYRLLHKCEDLHITYCTSEGAIGANEPSRYILQIEKELSRENTNIKINKRIYALKPGEKKLVTQIEKTPEIISRLDQLFEASSSASMLKKYIACPLDFYFRYIMEFGEEDEVEEEIEHSTFGTFIHNTLEELYTPFARFDKNGNEVFPKPKNITSLDVEGMLKNYLVILKSEFSKHFNGDQDAFLKGKNRLAYQMAQELTERFLKAEILFLSQQKEPVFIEALERLYEEEIELEIFGEPKKVKIRGYIDRIDSIGEKIRIIDYKSGKVDESEVKFFTQGDVKEVSIKSMKEKKHILQLMQYAYLYAKKHNVYPESSIISFVSGKHAPFTLNTNKFDYNECIERFPEFLKEIIEDIYDKDVPFSHNSNDFRSYCQYCD